MNFLAIDTTMQQLSIALSVNGHKIARVIDTKAKKHNSELLPQIHRLFTETNSSIKDIDVFGVVNGPGSFTGIRVGVAVTNAFSFAFNKQIVEITALEIAAFKYKNEKILAMIDCKHNNYYAALSSNDFMEYMEITETQSKDFGIKRVLYEKPDAESLLKLMEQKIANKQFTDTAKPFYMKKSSAERENEY